MIYKREKRICGHAITTLPAIVLIASICAAATADDSAALRSSSASGHSNELLITTIYGQGGGIHVFEHRDGAYQEVWSTIIPGATVVISGGVAGDLTGDGIPEVALGVQYPVDTVVRTEVWTFDRETASWYELWSEDGLCYFGSDILDVDNDGVNEFLCSTGYGPTGDGGELVLYSWTGSGFEVESVVRDCAPQTALYTSTAADSNGNGTSEIFDQCSVPENLYVYEHQGAGTYPVIGEVVLPPNASGTSTMLIDDMDAGDVNGDSRADAVFCGNSGAVHVVTYDTALQSYELEYSSPPPASSSAYAFACNAGDVTNDGWADILVVNAEGAKVYSHNGTEYQEIWASEPVGTCTIGNSAVGDADNDGFTEFLFCAGNFGEIRLYENDTAGATTFFNTVSFPGVLGYTGTTIIADLNPFNILASSFESGDTSAWSATVP